MAVASRDNSQIEIAIDRRGNMSVSVGGVRVPSMTVRTDSAMGKGHGVTTIEIPTFLITFVHDKDDG